MRAPDERLAAVAYTYAWWLTGGDDAAIAVLREVLEVADDGGGEGDAVGLLEGVRAQVGDVRPMCPASELALLHDGLGVPLDAAAGLSSIPQDDSRVQLAHGRLEALLETVREEFAHPERLGGLAVANPPDVAHARQCPSCARASSLIERGRAELREVAAASPPPGLLQRLAEAPAPPAEAPPAETDAEAVRVHDVLEAPAPYAARGDAPLAEPSAPGEVPVVGDAPATAAPTAPPAEVPERPPVPPAEAPPPPPAPERVELSPMRRRLIWILTGLGLILLFLVVPTLIASAPDDAPVDVPTTRPGQSPAPQPTQAPRPTPTPTTGFGPPVEDTTEFSVVDAGILRSGETDPAPPGTTISPDEPLRVAVDYRNATDGAPITARWLVNDEPYLRLDAVLTGQASRHVWGVPQPEAGWPLGQHRILLASEGMAVGAVDFVVRSQG